MPQTTKTQISRGLPAGETAGSVEQFIRRYVVVTDEQAVALVLWVAHTWAFEAASTTPYLAITSPVMRSGKSRLFEVLELLVREPLFTSSISPSGLFRTIHDLRPTLLLDEVDARGVSEQLRGILNDGYRRGGKVIRVEKVGSFMVPTSYSTFCAKAFAGIGRPLPPTVMDRSIPIRLQRKAPDEHVDRFRRLRAEQEAEAIQAHLALLGEPAIVEQLADAHPSIPDVLNDRAADVWEPLLALAEMIGWGDAARAAAVILSGGQEEGDPRVQVLADIKRVFEMTRVERISTADLLRFLHMLAAPAFEGDYQRVTPMELARLLRPFEIKPKVMRAGAEPVRGYERIAFEDAFRRYVP